MTVTLRPLAGNDMPRFDAWLEAEAAERLGLPDALAAGPLVAVQRRARRHDLATRGAAAFVVERAGEPVGYLALERIGDALVLVDLYVTPSARRQGIAHAAIRTALVEHRAGASNAVLSVERSHPITAFYHRIGFVEVEGTPTHRRMRHVFEPELHSPLAYGAPHV